MANLGFQAVYHLLNGIDACVCERAFLPDDEECLEFERSETPLFSLESQRPLKEFDIVAFSIAFEDDYQNVLRILRLAGIPAESSARKTLKPIVLAGGVAPSLNPEPLARFVDIFSIGEAEGFLRPIIDMAGGLANEGAPRPELIKRFDEIPWIYVPALYDYEFDGTGIRQVSINTGAKKKVLAAKNSVTNLERHEIPRSFVKTPEALFAGATLFEVERGCTRLCRFCAAGFLYLPPRWRGIDKIKDSFNMLNKGDDSTGVANRVGIVGAAVSEHPHIREVLECAIGLNAEATLSSLRLDMLDEGFLTLLKKAGYSTITVAPEAGSERMRGVINKNISEAEILHAARLIKDAGFNKIKMYFLVGLPEEEDLDAEAIASLSTDIKGILKKCEITLSINPFIPKPLTPFQWSAFERVDVIEKRISIIKKALLRQKGFKLTIASPRTSFAQAYVSRADRRAGAFISDIEAEGLAKAVKKNRPFMEGSAYRPRQKDEILPWDLIDHGVKKGFLWNEHQKSLGASPTAACDVGRCFKCGVCVPEKRGYNH
ncbi:MAG: radical SAM protein [Deltaproteobacteria bacterium]